MGMGSWWHWAIVIAVVLILFGGKKIPELMKGIGTGIKGFKKAIKEDDEDLDTNKPKITQQTTRRTGTKSSSPSTRTTTATKRGRPKKA